MYWMIIIGQSSLRSNSVKEQVHRFSLLAWRQNINRRLSVNLLTHCNDILQSREKLHKI